MKKEKKEKKAKKVKGGKSKISLFTLLMLLSLIPLIVAVAIISTISLSVIKTNLEKEAEATLHIVANDLSNYCHENEINAINASDYYDYLDSLKDQGLEMAIIIEGAPCATSIKNENDYRIREVEFEKDIVADKAEIENGYYDKNVLIDGKAYYGYYMPILSENEIIGMAFAGKLQVSVSQAIQNSIISFVGVAVLLIVMFAIVTLIFSKSLSKSFEAVNKSVNALSQGNIGKQQNKASKIKEIDTVLQATENMQGNLSGIIGKVKTVSNDLIENVVQVTKLSESSSGRARQITTAMDELAVTTEGMAENVQDINQQMLEIGNCVNDISRNVDHLYSSSENILHTNNEAKISMDVIMTNSEKSVNAVKNIAAQIRETNDSITEVDQAVELILNISQQTNLLSLNASIEAARAGSFGRGFAVVAEEIRRLSEQSAEGAEMIKNLAHTITEKSKKSVELTDQVQSLIELEQKSVTETQEKYAKLSENIDQSVNEIKSIAEKTDYLSMYKEKVIDNVQSLSAISEENTASNEEVCANVSEIMSEVQVVNDNCESMDQMAEELRESVSYFHD